LAVGPYDRHSRAGTSLHVERNDLVTVSANALPRRDADPDSPQVPHESARCPLRFQFRARRGASTRFPTTHFVPPTSNIGKHDTQMRDPKCVVPARSSSGSTGAAWRSCTISAGKSDDPRGPIRLNVETRYLLLGKPSQTGATVERAPVGENDEMKPWKSKVEAEEHVGGRHPSLPDEDLAVVPTRSPTPDRASVRTHAATTL
jgi:hypothetical protein